MKDSRKTLLVVLGLLALTLAAYWNSFEAGFALDNRPLLLGDPRLRAVTPENLGLILHHTYWWPYAETGLYRPFTTLSYLFNYAVLGDGENAGGYHLVNFLLHALNVLLVYALARRFLAGRWPPALVAALWAVHPVLTESVTNMIGRSDLLAGASILSGFWFYLKAAEASDSRRFAWLGALAAVTTIGVFSKESAVAILGVLALYELAWWHRGKSLSSLLPAYLAVQVPILAMWLARSAVLARSPRGAFAFTDNPLIGAAFWPAKLTALTVLGRYFWLMLWPSRLSADYSYSQIPLSRGSLTDWAAWLTVILALAVAVWLFRRNRAAAFFLLFAFVNLIPVANGLFPIGTIMAERFLYLPSLGLSACILMAIYGRLRPPLAASVLLCLITVAFAVRTYARNADWHDDLSLASADAEASPESYKTHYRLAGALYDADKTHANIAAALAEVEKGMAILERLPDQLNTPTIYRAAGGFYLVQGGRLLAKGPNGEMVLTPESRAAHERSRQVLERCAAIISAMRSAGLEPAYSEEADVRRMLSAGYLRLNEMPLAFQSAQEARRLDPLEPAMYWQLFNVLITQDQADEAATVLFQGALVTGDASMSRELIRLYQMGLDPKGCAVVARTGTLNPNCETVHAQLCAASAGLEQLAREAPTRDIALRLGKFPVLGCAAASK